MTADAARPPLDLSRRFDGEAAWAALAEPVRVAIGATFLSLLAADEVIEHAAETDDLRLARVGFAAQTAAERTLSYIGGEIALPALAPGQPSGEPPIPALVGMVCEACGCSERDPCPNGCGWARDNLCTACAPATSG